jgi:hypothetical protein
MDDWFTHMRRGDFAAAWEISDRLRDVWDGTPLANRRVLIRCDHGLGDTIQFARFFPLVKAIAAECTILAQPSLLPLLQLPPGNPEAEHDVEVECMELAHVFRVTVDTIPPAPYLHVDPYLWSSGRFGRRIGIVWRAGDWDPKRSIPRETIERLFDLPYTFHSLQRGESDLPADDPLSTARVMRALDLVITVDTMTAHLAGALGVPVFTLLPHEHDWRWMDGRTDSPWYPSMRLFRQPRAGDWDSVIDEVRYAISTMADETKKDSLNEWGIDVDKFKERAKESLATAKGDLSEITGTLRQTLVSAKDVVLGLQNTGAPAAAELKAGFERAWKEIETAFRAAREKATAPPPTEPPPASPGGEDLQE